MQPKEIHKIITVEDIKSVNDIWEINQPMFWTIDIYESYEEYLKSAELFTLEQRYLNAIFWYFAEVGNGGHCQFFTNSTGIVWQDTVNGFHLFGLEIYAQNLQKIIDYFQGKIPFDREQREELFDNTGEEFDELLDECDDFVFEYEADISSFVLNNAEKFTFEGVYYEY